MVISLSYISWCQCTNLDFAKMSYLAQICTMQKYCISVCSFCVYMQSILSKIHFDNSNLARNLVLFQVMQHFYTDIMKTSLVFKKTIITIFYFSINTSLIKLREFFKNRACSKARPHRHTPAIKYTTSTVFRSVCSGCLQEKDQSSLTRTLSC